MSVSPTTNAAYCYGANCTNAFVTVQGPNGQTVDIDPPLCSPDCRVCEPVACPALCAAPSRVTTTGVTQTWTGTEWLGGSCGSGPSLACTSTSCAPDGHYTATLCAFLDASASPIACGLTQQNQVCKDFAFDWPPAGGSATIKWVIGDADAE
jgi:hypothetical protein